MSDRKTRGIVLRETDYKESDRLLTVLSEDFGLLTLKVRGIRRSKFLYRSACELLSWSEFTFRDYNGFFTLSEASCLENFLGLRSEIEKLSLAMYFAQVIELIAQEDAPSTSVLRLLLNSLYALSNLPEPTDKVKAAFEWRASVLAGYEADLSACPVCGNRNPDRLLINQGSLICSQCMGDDETGIRMPIDSALLSALRFLSAASDKKLLAFSLEGMDYSALSCVTEAYLLSQLEHSFSSLDFYKSLNYSFSESNL